MFRASWSWLILSCAAASGFTLLPVSGRSAVRVASLAISMQESTPLDALQTGVKLFLESRQAGSGFKQAVADSLAGEHDRAAAEAEVTAIASSAPLVVFTWASSPACKKALRYFEFAGVTPKIERLDDPWSEGNPKRAALGRITGKSSVPSIWIGGKYVGGCDDGPSDDAPGIVKMAFEGTLPAALEAAGATRSDSPRELVAEEAAA